MVSSNIKRYRRHVAMNDLNGASSGEDGLMRFVLNGVARQLDAETVSSWLRDVTPEAVREHGVRVGALV